MTLDDILSAQSAETILPTRPNVNGLILPYYNASSAILLRPDGGLELWQTNDKQAELVQVIEPDQRIDAAQGFEERQELRTVWARAVMLSAQHILRHIGEHEDICAWHNWRSKYLVMRSALRELVGADQLRDHDGGDYTLPDEEQQPTFSQAMMVVSRELQRISDLT